MRGVLITVDLDAPWRLHPDVALRDESFGALAYHFGTRRLSFMKDPLLVDVVRRLGDSSSARRACLAAGVPADRMPAVERALVTLAASTMIVRSDRSTTQPDAA